MDEGLIIRIDGDDSEYDKKLKSVKSKTAKTVGEISSDTADKLNKSMKNSNELVSGLNKTVKGLALGIGVAGTTILGMGISFNLQIEQYTAGFSTMLGSAEKANETLGKLRSFAEKTPFELTDLANASTTLLAFGENIDNLMPDLKMLGDISLGNSEKFKSLALVFGQVQSQGRLMGQDLLQMINAGFNPLQVISQKTGESMASLKERMADGEISFEMVADAMKTATSEGGQFYNAMETQSKTLSGQWSTLKDNITSLTGDIASDISGRLTQKVLPDLINMVEDLKNAWADGSLQDSIGTVTSCVVSFGVAVGTLNLLLIANDLINVKKGVEQYTAATKLGTTAQKLFNAELLKNPYTLITAALIALIAGVVTYAATHKSETAKIREQMEELNKEYKTNIESIEESAEAEKNEAEKVMLLRDELFKLDEQLKSNQLTQEEANSAKEDFKIIAEELNQIIPGITDNIIDETGEINLQKDAVNDLCDSYYNLVLAKATANAAAKKIEEAQGKILEQKKKQSDAYKKVDGSLSNAFAAGHAGKMEVNLKEAKEYADIYLEAEDNIAKLNEDISLYMDELKEANKKINELSSDSKETVSENLKKTTSTTKKETKKQTDAIKEQKKEEIRILQNSYNQGELSSEEYFEKLKNYKDNYSDALKELQEEELNNLNYLHDVGEISDKEYYDKLIEFRDKYFEQGSQRWKQYTSEVYSYTEKLKNNIVDKFNEMSEKVISDIEELDKTQESFSNKLKSYSNKYSIETITVKLGENQDDIVYKRAVLPDYKKANEDLSRYAELLGKVESRGDIPLEFFQALRDLSVEDGILMAEALLKLSDDEFNNHVAEWKENQNLSDKYSKDLHEKEFENLEKSVDREVQLLKDEFEREFGKLPDNFFDLGLNSAEGFKDGFVSVVQGILDEIMSSINEAMASVATSGYSVGSAGGNSYYYSSSYTVTASNGESTQQQLSQIKAAETLNMMRGGY